jgi:hypothetical protein
MTMMIGGNRPASVPATTMRTNSEMAMNGTAPDVDALAVLEFGRIGAEFLTRAARGRFLSSTVRS